MLVTNLKKYSPVNLLIFIVLAVLLWLKTFMDNKIPGIYIDNDPMPVYSWIFHLLNSSTLSLLCKIIALILTILQGTLIIGIINQYNLIGIRSYLPGIIFLIITANLPEYQMLHPTSFATLILLLAWNQLVHADYEEKPLSSYFNASLLLGLATLFYPNFIYLTILFLIIPFLNRGANLRECGMIIVGILTVWYFYFSLYFIFTSKFNISGLEYNLSFSLPEFIQLKKGQLIFFLYLALLVILASIQSSQSMANQKIQMRRNLKIFFFWFVFSILIFIFTNSSFELIYLIGIPTSILLTLFFSISSLKWIKEIIFLFILAITFINQLYPDLFNF